MTDAPADLPPLDNGGPILSSFELMPAWRFYLPIFLEIARLGMRYGLTTLTAANPSIPTGGLVGESKAQVLDLVTGPARDLIAPYIKVTRQPGEAPLAGLKDQMTDAGLAYPVVAKPDVSCRGAGVRRLRSDEDLRAYWECFPANADFMVQALVPWEPEAGIFYARDPDTDAPRIISLTLKYTPSVIGDGQSTLQQLIEADRRAAQAKDIYLAKPGLEPMRIPGSGERVAIAFAGNHCRGSVFRDGRDYITPELTAAIDEVTRAIPGYHFGRFDVRFESLAELQRGRGFKIIEFNGVGSEAVHVWDNRYTLKQAREDLRAQYRLAYAIGAAQRRKGVRPSSLMDIITAWQRERRLVQRYPVSE